MADERNPSLLPTGDRTRSEEQFDPDETRTQESTVERTPPFVGDIGLTPSIAGYEITGELARGGMGVVYSAKDLKLKREVAIKTLLPGKDATRFVIESEIAARLPHPGIPPVYALGELDDGSPYLAMKLIRGRTLYELLKRRSSPADELSKFIAIFEQIAQAVGFAHEQGIIHRDLKPLNVMVGAFGEVQVMDWGLAKDLVSREIHPSAPGTADDLALTSAGTVMGTPGYMAPEQARGEPADARADVFSLGAILASILTGKPAFVGTTADETIKKSKRGDLADTLERLASSGADEDLVAIAKDCLAIDAANRPPNARTVAERIADYRLGVEQRLKQAETAKAEALVREAEGKKRRRVMISSGAIVVLVLSVGLGVSLWQRNVALKRLTQVEKGNEVLASVFRDLDIRLIREGNEPIEALLAKRLVTAGEQLTDEAVGDALTVARLQSLLGSTLTNLGFGMEAATLCERALQTQKAMLGPQHADTLESMGELASALRAAGKLDRALPLYEETLNLKKASLGPDDHSTLTSMNDYALGLQEAGKLDEALELFEETFNLKRSNLGSNHPDVLSSMNNLALTLKAAGKLDRAVVLFEEALKLTRETAGPDHPDTLNSMSNLASTLTDVGAIDRAIPLLEETYKLQSETLGSDHPETLTSLNHLAQGLCAAGKREAGLPLLEKALRLRKSKLGPDHPNTLQSMNNLASALHSAGELDKAISLHEQTLQIAKSKLGDDHPNTLTSMNNLARALHEADQLNRALPLYEETLKRSKATLGDDHPKTLNSMNSLAMGLSDAGKLEQALPIYEETLKLRKAKLGDDHPETLDSMNNLALGLQNAGKFDRAVPLLEETLRLTKAKLGDDHFDTLNSMSNLAAAYWSSRRLDRSVPLFEETLKLYEAKCGRGHPETLRTIANLGVNYKDAGRLKESVTLLEEAYAAATKYKQLRWVVNPLAEALYAAGEDVKFTALWKRQVADARRSIPADSLQLAAMLAQFGDTLLQHKKCADAESLLRECLPIREKTQPDHWTTFNTQSMLGAALLGQKKYAEAEPLLLKGYEGMKQREKLIPPQGAIRIPESIDRLVELYTATNKSDEAKKWQAERAKYPAATKLKAAEKK